jgi:hypothetical protein
MTWFCATKQDILYFLLLDHRTVLSHLPLCYLSIGLYLSVGLYVFVSRTAYVTSLNNYVSNLLYIMLQID